MKKVFKRTVALVLSVIMLIFAFAGCSNKTNNSEVEQEADNGYITRGEWLEMLADTFGFDDYEQETAYYTDVDPENELFAAVQSCRERSMLSENTTEFKADEVATLGFVASTAVLASGIDYTKYAEADDDINTALIKCAKGTNLCPDITTEDSVLRSGVNEVYAASVIEAAQGLFLADTGEEVYDVAYADGVIDTSEDENVSVDDNGNLQMDEVAEVGSIVVCPATEEYPNGYAVKVTGVSYDENGNPIYETTEAEFAEVYEHAEIATTVNASADNFIPAEGVAIVKSTDPEAEQSRCEEQLGGFTTLETNTEDTGLQQTKTAEFEDEDSVELSIKYENGGIVSASVDDGKSKIEGKYESEEAVKEAEKNWDVKELFNDSSEEVNKYLEDYGAGKISGDELNESLNQIKEKYENNTPLTYKQKFDKGWSIEGTVEVKLSTEVAAEITTEWFLNPKIKYYCINLKDEITSSIKLEGNYTGEFKLGYFDIPIYAGASVEVALIANFELDGSITYSLTYAEEQKIQYKNNKTTKTDTSSVSNKTDIEVKFSFNFGLNVSINLLTFNIIDVEVTAGLEVTADASAERKISTELSQDTDGNAILIYREQLIFHIGIKLVLPIVKVKVGTSKSLCGKLGLSFTYQFISADDIEKGKVGYYLHKEFPEKGKEDDATVTLCEIPIPLHEEDETTTSEEDETTSGSKTTEAETVEAGTLVLNDFSVIVEAGKSYKISLSALPAEYTEADLVWSVDDTSIATVSGGTVTGKSQGQTVVTVKTVDGKYSGQCAVLVN